MATVAVTAVSLLAFAALTFAAYHTVNGTGHGIGSSTGGGVGAGQPVSLSVNSFYRVLNVAAMYHVSDNGAHTQQCSDGPEQYEAECWGTWGTAPCQKRSYTQSYIVGLGDQTGWHWMRGASCAGQTHQ
jgi:hypothetical protein